MLQVLKCTRMQNRKHTCTQTISKTEIQILTLTEEHKQQHWQKLKHVHTHKQTSTNTHTYIHKHNHTEVHTRTHKHIHSSKQTSERSCMKLLFQDSWVLEEEKVTRWQSAQGDCSTIQTENRERRRASPKPLGAGEVWPTFVWAVVCRRIPLCRRIQMHRGEDVKQLHSDTTVMTCLQEKRMMTGLSRWLEWLNQISEVNNKTS